MQLQELLSVSVSKERQSSLTEIKKVYSLCIIHPTTVSSQGSRAVNVWNEGKQRKKCNRNGNKVFFHVLAAGTKLLNTFAQDGRMWDMKPSGRTSGILGHPWGFSLWLWKVLQEWFSLDPLEGRRDTPTLSCRTAGGRNGRTGTWLGLEGRLTDGSAVLILMLLNKPLEVNYH